MTGSIPCLASVDRTTGNASALLKAALSNDTSRGLMPRGPMMPNQLESSMPGRPASAVVGTSGSVLSRRGAAMAITRTRPLSTNEATPPCGQRVNLQFAGGLSLPCAPRPGEGDIPHLGIDAPRQPPPAEMRNRAETGRSVIEAIHVGAC